MMDTDISTFEFAVLVNLIVANYLLTVISVAVGRIARRGGSEK